MATVFIWNNNIISAARGGTSHYTTGHASLNIDDQWCEDYKYPYVTWWAEGVPFQYHTVIKNFIADINNARYAPDHIIKIPSPRLNTLHMHSAWDKIRQSRKMSYNELFNNCSTVVSHILLAGTHNTKYGGRLLKHKHIVWTPLRVKRLAYDLQGYDMAWANFINEVNSFLGLSDYCNELLSKKRRSSRHGYQEAAPARFINGKDTNI
ncbi:MAG: hypothetical protein PUP46_08815 [Endozoicomonas sp. (ex Botrylloides leachii)]|nr:hypothetical protein [Endozoicomonas sp. (ex Botrylloides leachii)]